MSEDQYKVPPPTPEQIERAKQPLESGMWLPTDEELAVIGRKRIKPGTPEWDRTYNPHAGKDKLTDAIKALIDVALKNGVITVDGVSTFIDGCKRDYQIVLHHLRRRGKGTNGVRAFVALRRLRMEEKTLPEFIELLKADIAAFEAFYTKGMESEDNYPLSQDVPSWYEQFDVFIETIHEDDDEDEDGEESDECDDCDGTGVCQDCGGEGCAENGVENETCEGGHCGVCGGSGTSGSAAF